MWKLKIGGEKSPWLETLNDHVGRQYWEFDPNAGTPEERLAVENARAEYYKTRFLYRHSGDLLMRLQVHIFQSLPFNNSPVSAAFIKKNGDYIICFALSLILLKSFMSI